MDRLSAFTTLNFEPVLPESNPSLRTYLRERGLPNPTPFPVILVQTPASPQDNIPTDDLLRKQLRFEGKSPIEIDTLVERARTVEHTSQRIGTLNAHFELINNETWLADETDMRSLGERKSRIAHWWRVTSRSVLVWGAVFSAALVVMTALLARQGSSLNPVIGVGAVISVLLTVYAGWSTWRTSRVTEHWSEHDTALWVQTIHAVELSAVQKELLDLVDTLKDHQRDEMLNIGELSRPLKVAQGKLDETLEKGLFQYNQHLLAARAAAESAGQQAMVGIADDQLRQLAQHSALFNAGSGVDQAHPNPRTRATTANHASDRTLAITLAALFALVISPAVLGLPSLAIAVDKCSYAIAEVRIDSCPDITGLDATYLDLTESDLSDRDVSRSDFTSTLFDDADLTNSDFTFTNLTDASLTKTTARGSMFRGAQATAADFSGSDLRQADLTEADISDANFEEVDLERARFTGSVANAATFNGSDAEGADFTETDLTGADFSDVTLTDAVFLGANLSGADLSGADLSGADLRGIDFQEVDLKDAVLTDVNLSGVNLAGLDLSGLNLAGADLSDADLTNASLADANLLEADLSGAQISGLTLAGASLGGVSVKALLAGGADLSDVDLSGADLSGLAGSEINLPGATLDGVDLSGYDLAGSILDGASLVGSNLEGATLSGGSFIGTNFSDASFAIAELSEATFTEARFTSADMTDVRALDGDFREATFTGAELEEADFSGSNMRNARGLGSNAAAAQWVDATCPDGQRSEICRS
jgi:uncharacterized protein YjbI with pentapeptide repeats